MRWCARVDDGDCVFAVAYLRNKLTETIPHTYAHTHSAANRPALQIHNISNNFNNIRNIGPNQVTYAW